MSAWQWPRTIVQGGILGILVLSTGACVNSTANKSWGQAQWPSLQEFGAAARTAARQPQTWAPLVGAALLQIDDVDEKWSQDLAHDQPLFGSDADDVSDDLRDVSTAAYALTALLAPSENVGDKARGLAVGVSTMVLDGVVSQGLKDIVGRERPNGRNDQSMPSGHASKASSRTNMAIRNLEYINMPQWQRKSPTWVLHGVAGGAGLARVEANKHHLSDVLVGYALGHFLSEFMYEAFLQGNPRDLELSFTGIGRGGVLALTLPLQ